MTRFLVLLLVLGILTAAGTTLVVAQDKDKKEEKKDKDGKDKDKDKDKKDKDKDKKDKDKDKEKKDKDGKDKDGKDKDKKDGKDKKDKDKDSKDKDKDKEKPVEKALTEEQKKEIEALSGLFKVKSFKKNGDDAPEADLKKMKVVQKGQEWSFHSKDDNVTKGKDTPYPGKTPKEIDSLYTTGTHIGKVVKGIYKIEGNTITFCWAEPDKDRPTKFTADKGTDLTLMVFEKATEADFKTEDKKDKDGKDKDKKEEKKDKDGKDKDKDGKDKKDKDK